MDAVEFLNQLYRRYKSAPDLYLDNINLNCMEPVSFVEQIETWAKEHPVKTRRNEFLKHYPNAVLNNSGILEIDPCSMEKGYNVSTCSGNCFQCRKDYWLEEVD